MGRGVTIKVAIDYVLVTFELKMRNKKETKEGDVTKNVTKNVPLNVPINKLNERQLNILNLIKENPSISMERMADINHVNMRTIKRDLDRMSEFVRRVGPKKNGHWEIIGEV